MFTDKIESIISNVVGTIGKNDLIPKRLVQLAGPGLIMRGNYAQINLMM